MTTLGDLCNFGETLDDADFWIIAQGDEIGKPVDKKATRTIGVKVTRTDVLLPKYLYYVFQHQHNQGVYASFTKLTPEILKGIQVG